MIRRVVDVWIPGFPGGNIIPGDGPGNVDGPADLGRIHVVAVFVQAPHGVQGIQQGLQLRLAGNRPRNPDQPHTGGCGDSLDHGLAVHCPADILQPQGGDIGIGRDSQVCQGRLVHEGQV